METSISPVMVAALVVPFVLLGIAAVVVDLSQSRRNRADAVVATWGDLRITKTFLIVGYRQNALRIPLAGLTARTTETGAQSAEPMGHRIGVTIDGFGGGSLYRDEPYSYGSVGAARTFEILLNRAGQAPSLASEAPALRHAA